VYVFDKAQRELAVLLTESGRLCDMQNAVDMFEKAAEQQVTFGSV